MGRKSWRGPFDLSVPLSHSEVVVGNIRAEDVKTFGLSISHGTWNHTITFYLSTSLNSFRALFSFTGKRLKTGRCQSEDRKLTVLLPEEVAHNVVNSGKPLRRTLNRMITDWQPLGEGKGRFLFRRDK